MKLQPGRRGAPDRQTLRPVASRQAAEPAGRPAPTGRAARAKLPPRRTLPVLALLAGIAAALCVLVGLRGPRAAGPNQLAAHQSASPKPPATARGRTAADHPARSRTAPERSPTGATSGGGHPIDPALRIAREGLQFMRRNIRDYTAEVVKRERAKSGKLGEPQVMFCKIRNRKVDQQGRILVPFSIYLKFLQPRSIAGREVIWVENQNHGKLIAHEPGLRNLFRFQLDPKGLIAMMGQRYSLDNLGLENLIIKLIERGERERRDRGVQVQFIKGAKLGGRTCTLIQVVHPEKKPGLDYYMAKIFIDEDRHIPLRYAAFMWPETPKGDPPLDEEYIYRNVKLNVGLTDEDFNPDNPAYDFP